MSSYADIYLDII